MLEQFDRRLFVGSQIATRNHRPRLCIAGTGVPDADHRWQVERDQYGPEHEEQRAGNGEPDRP